MSKEVARRSLIEHFRALEDPRQACKVVYPLPEIMRLVLCATLAAAEDFVEIRRWGREKLSFLRTMLPFAHGIPSHDTLNDVMNALDPALFSECFSAWVEGLRAQAPDIVAVDGKSSRRARRGDAHPLHVVSAWASRQRLVLGQQAVDERANEIVAIPLLLERLQLTGALVTIDAMGGHGRIEVRRHTVCHDVGWLLSDRRYPGEPRFPGLKAIAMVEAEVERDGKTSLERRYFLSSLALDAKLFARAVRAHWDIENRLHWVLDVVFHDDLMRLRTEHGPKNMATVKHMAMNLLRNAADKDSLKTRRKAAAWNHDYLRAIVTQTA